MARRPSEETARQREALRDRVQFLLRYHWAGNQRQMARDLAVSQGLISKIVNGQQGAGRRFLTTLAHQPGVNAEWVLRGEGQPLALPLKGTLPLALGVLPGPPLEYPHLLTGQRHSVAEALDRASRYWLELQASSPLLRDNALRLLGGDLMLMETDPAWTSRLDLIEGRLCGVRCRGGLPGPAYALGKLYRNPLGLVLDALGVVLRLALPPSAPSPPYPTTPEPPTAGAQEHSRKRMRRKIRFPDREKEKAEERRQAQERINQETSPGQPRMIGEPEDQGEATFTPQDIVAVCVYLARPSPGLVRTEAAERKDSP